MIKRFKWKNKTSHKTYPVIDRDQKGNKQIRNFTTSNIKNHQNIPVENKNNHDLVIS